MRPDPYEVLPFPQDAEGSRPYPLITAKPIDYSKKRKLFFRLVDKLVLVLEYLREQNLWDRFDTHEDIYFITTNSFKSVSIERYEDSVKYIIPTDRHGLLVHNHPGCSPVWPSPKDLKMAENIPRFVHAVVGSKWDVVLYDAEGAYAYLENEILYLEERKCFM